MERILLIDDEAAIRLLGKRALEGAGFDVTVVENGESALESFRADPHDLVISDLYLPGEGILEAVAMIKKERADVPVLVISGMDLEDENLKAASARTGVTSTLMKPFELNVFVRTVQNCLKP